MVDQLYHGLLAGSDDYGSYGRSLKWFCSCHMAVDDEIQSLKTEEKETGIVN